MTLEELQALELIHELANRYIGKYRDILTQQERNRIDQDIEITRNFIYNQVEDQNET